MWAGQPVCQAGTRTRTRRGARKTRDACNWFSFWGAALNLIEASPGCQSRPATPVQTGTQKREPPLFKKMQSNFLHMWSIVKNCHVADFKLIIHTVTIPVDFIYLFRGEREREERGKSIPVVRVTPFACHISRSTSSAGPARCGCLSARRGRPNRAKSGPREPAPSRHPPRRADPPRRARHATRSAATRWSITQYVVKLGSLEGG